MKIFRKRRSLAGRLGALFLLVASANAWGNTFYAANSSGTLSLFDTTSPGSLPITSVAITGLGLGESVVGIDIRPLDLQLYALTKDGSGAGRLYVVDTTSGAATLVVLLTPNPLDAVPYSSLTGTRFAMAFNPQVDRIRLITDSGQSYRINPSTGVVIHDTDLNSPLFTPHAAAAAYTNSFRGTTSTVLYDIDTINDALLLHLNSPNSGLVAMVGAGLGVNMVDLVGFDTTMVGTTNVAFATALVGGSINLYSIDLVTGHASLIGGLNGNFQTVGIAIVPDRIFANGFE